MTLEVELFSDRMIQVRESACNVQQLKRVFPVRPGLLSKRTRAPIHIDFWKSYVPTRKFYITPFLDTFRYSHFLQSPSDLSSASFSLKVNMHAHFELFPLKHSQLRPDHPQSFFDFSIILPLFPGYNLLSSSAALKTRQRIGTCKGTSSRNIVRINKLEHNI